MAEIRKSLTGISGILVTPFDADDSIAPQRLGAVIDHAVGAGVHVLTANGNTGEFYGLVADEAERMVHAVTGLVAGRVPVVGGVGRSVGEARALARASVAAGVDALMIHQPPIPSSRCAGSPTTSAGWPRSATARRSFSICATMPSAPPPSRSSAPSRA